jgi:hypothetical protein
MTDFREILEALVLFECSDEEEKWKRCLVCGVCIVAPGIAVNTTQLKRLVLKCKSSINGSLKGLGFDKIITKPWAYEWFLQQIPYLRDRPTELRQWTIRFCSRPVSLGILGFTAATNSSVVLVPLPDDSTMTHFQELHLTDDSTDDVADIMSDC